MASNEDVVKLVQEAVRQFGAAISKSTGDTSPSIALSDAPPVIKTVVVETSPKFAHDTARKLARMSAACVETWDGYVTINGVRNEAILVNYWTEGRGPVFFIQRYKRGPFEWVGDAIAGEDALRLQG